MKYALISTALTLSLILAGCTTIPTASSDFLSNTGTLEGVRGLRSKSLATKPPSPAVADDAKLTIDGVRFIGQVEASSEITQSERTLVANALARSACEYFSRRFEIVGAGAAPQSGYTLRMGITQLDSTSKFGAAFGMASDLASPIGGIRPPIGLGGLTVEFELVRPNGAQAAAMVWSRHADIFATNSAASRIGDAYRFASMASLDFAKLAARQDGPNSNGPRNSSFSRSKPDEACDGYGKDATGLARVAGSLGFPFPPESVDSGPTSPH
jgi:Protein of unknown function (DUF3313)